jgi:membrane protein
MMQVLASAVRLVRLVFARFGEDRCVQVAGSLTFTTLLALVPLVAIAVTLIAAFPVFEQWSNEIKIFILLNFVPEAGGKIITGYMQQFADNATRLTAVGILFLVVTALLLMVTIERVFNVIWRVRRERPVLNRLVIYWAALTVGPLLIGASLSLTSWLVSYSMGIARAVPGGDSMLVGIVPLALNALAFAFLYLTLPNRRIRTRDALIGGLTAAIAFELMKRGFGFYVTSVPTYAAVYGTFATVPIFLLWIFLSWTVVLFGAVVVAVLPRWRIGADVAEAVPGRRFYRVLRILRVLQRAHRRGETPTTLTVARAAVLSEEDAEEALIRVEGQGWACRVLSGGWALVRDLGTLTAADVYRAFVFRIQPETSGDSAMDGDIASVAQVISARVEEDLDRPLGTFFQTEDLPEIESDKGSSQSSQTKVPPASS